ncbi:tyrosine-type recombinase/integrase [Limnobacter sp. 130]|uniref:tyrosine-type recombinase/integrase n=1 Tax=Limnobacter sp. 130 TaxID=2653147 RepID=UPI00135C8E4C|nr:tyrosine-type recombinase/integrase [Limnobacter sp. 130]
MRDDEKRRSRGLVNEGEFHLLGMSHTPASLRKLLLLEGRNWSGIAPEIAKQWLHEQSIEMPEDSEAFLDLVSMIRLEAFECLEILELRAKGIPVKSPPIIKVDKPIMQVGILNMLEPWKVVKKPAASSVRVFAMAASRFEELHPKKSLADIERVDIVTFRDWLTTTKGLAAATVEQQMSAIKALLSIALDRDIVKVNVATKVMPPKRTLKEQDARRPFSVSQLNQLFSSPIYQGKKIPSGGKGPAAVWLPLLALFTGGRMEELCQLRVEDVLEEDGIPYLFIRNEHEEQSIKNRGSVRRVPLHQELLRLGFLTYVEKQRVRGREWVFSELAADVHGKRSGNWSKWFSRYLREVVGVVDKDVVFHSLRHNFIDCCRDSKIGEEVHDAMTGHRNGSVSRSYGSSLYPLGPLSDAIKQYRVKGLTLPLKL